MRNLCIKRLSWLLREDKDAESLCDWLVIILEFLIGQTWYTADRKRAGSIVKDNLDKLDKQTSKRIRRILCSAKCFREVDRSWENRVDFSVAIVVNICREQLFGNTARPIMMWKMKDGWLEISLDQMNKQQREQGISQVTQTTKLILVLVMQRNGHLILRGWGNQGRNAKRTEWWYGLNTFIKSCDIFHKY